MGSTVAPTRMVVLVAAFALPAAALATQAAASSRVDTAEAATAGAAARPADRARPIELPSGRTIYLECRGQGGPTVILVPGLDDAGDVWSHLDPGVRGPAVFAALARRTRVCTYDRPNTLLLTDRPSPSDPVEQPAGARSAVADLHALLRAGDVPGPYVLVGHSYGGLLVRLYASTHPRLVAGLVLVDALNERQRELLAPDQWAALAGLQLEPAPGFDPPLESVDLDLSFDQILRAKAARPLRPTMPVVVLTRGRQQPFPALPPPVPDPDTVEQVWQAAQGWLAGIVPYAQQVIATRSAHYIQTAEPKLVIDAVRRELTMARPATVRCRGGAMSCRARIGLAGGASTKRVTIRLRDTDLHLVSVRPNRRSLRGAYGLSHLRQRRGDRAMWSRSTPRSRSPAARISHLHLPTIRGR